MPRKQTETPKPEDDGKAWERFNALLNRAAQPIRRPEPGSAESETSGPRCSDD